MLTCFGKAHLKKDHLLCRGTNNFKISQCLQELVCLFSQNMVFDDASEMLERILPINLSNKQIQRVSEWYGDQLNPIIEGNQEAYIPQLPSITKPDEPTYVMTDGSMIYTRENQWMEMKLGRIFHGSSNITTSPKRKEITESIYVSHLGSIHDFFPKFERHLAKYRNKVFIGDGAKWIWNWVESNYPGSVQILDYYHANDKLEKFAKHHFHCLKQKIQWMKDQQDLLLNDQVNEVIEKVNTLRPRNSEAKLAKAGILNYFTEHEDRMMYKTYRSKGLLIGSGPIEAAHRKVIQQRLKLSGQKWSINGAQAIANLRCYKASGAWPIIENLIRLAA